MSTPVQTSTEKLLARKENGIGWIVFNNPARHNAVSLEMWLALTEVLNGYAEDPEVRVVILTGAGDKAFVAGADISQFKEKRTDPEAVKFYNTTADNAAESLRNCPKPTIAMVRGYCIGGGAAIATNCDIRIVAEDARFSVPAAKLGLGYRYSGIKRLIDLIGAAYTAEFFYTARQFTAQEANAMGLINRLVPVEELEKVTLEYASTISGNAPLTIAAVKRSLIEAAKDESKRDLARCQQMVDACYASEDYKEGQAAFAEKRKPVFKAR
jgi:enoyl-CoA hydratase